MKKDSKNKKESLELLNYFKKIPLNTNRFYYDNFYNYDKIGDWNYFNFDNKEQTLKDLSFFRYDNLDNSDLFIKHYDKNNVSYTPTNLYVYFVNKFFCDILDHSFAIGNDKFADVIRDDNDPNKELSTYHLINLFKKINTLIPSSLFEITQGGTWYGKVSHLWHSLQDLKNTKKDQEPDFLQKIYESKENEIVSGYKEFLNNFKTFLHNLAHTIKKIYAVCDTWFLINKDKMNELLKTYDERLKIFNDKDIDNIFNKLLEMIDVELVNADHLIPMLKDDENDDLLINLLNRVSDAIGYYLYESVLDFYLTFKVSTSMLFFTNALNKHTLLKYNEYEDRIKNEFYDLTNTKNSFDYNNPFYKTNLQSLLNLYNAFYPSKGVTSSNKHVWETWNSKPLKPLLSSTINFNGTFKESNLEQAINKYSDDSKDIDLAIILQDNVSNYNLSNDAKITSLSYHLVSALDFLKEKQKQQDIYNNLVNAIYKEYKGASFLDKLSFNENLAKYIWLKPNYNNTDLKNVFLKQDDITYQKVDGIDRRILNTLSTNNGDITFNYLTSKSDDNVYLDYLNNKTNNFYQDANLFNALNEMFKMQKESFKSDEMYRSYLSFLHFQKSITSQPYFNENTPCYILKEAVIAQTNMPQQWDANDYFMVNENNKTFIKILMQEQIDRFNESIKMSLNDIKDELFKDELLDARYQYDISQENKKIIRR